MHPARTALVVAASVTALALLAACGDDTGDPAVGGSVPTTASASDPSDDRTTEPSGPPACESVWQKDADLPRGYAGCTKDGSVVTPETVECSSGQRIVIYDNHYWAVRGHIIGYAPQGLRNDTRYAEVLYSCRA